jgi:hypothetical protein
LTRAGLQTKKKKKVQKKPKKKVNAGLFAIVNYPARLMSKVEPHNPQLLARIAGERKKKFPPKIPKNSGSRLVNEGARQSESG